jgi:hypothetical protein
MIYYSIAKFIHIVGALGIFAALGVEWLSLMNLRRAAGMAQIRDWMRVRAGIQRLSGISMASILISGFYMMAVGHIRAAWLIVAFWSLVLLALLGVVLAGRRMRAIQQSIATDSDNVAPTLHQQLRQPVLWIVMQTRLALALGIVFLMTLKPDLIRSLLTVGIAAILGLAWALLSLRHEQGQDTNFNTYSDLKNQETHSG